MRSERRRVQRVGVRPRQKTRVSSERTFQHLCTHSGSGGGGGGGVHSVFIRSISFVAAAGKLEKLKNTKRDFTLSAEVADSRRSSRSPSKFSLIAHSRIIFPPPPDSRLNFHSLLPRARARTRTHGEICRAQARQHAGAVEVGQQE